MPLIEEVGAKLLTCKDVLTTDDETSRVRQQAAALMQRTSNLLEFVVEKEIASLRSMAKFSYVTQRIFIYLIYEGFCGQDDQEN